MRSSDLPAGPAVSLPGQAKVLPLVLVRSAAFVATSPSGSRSSGRGRWQEGGEAERPKGPVERLWLGST